MSASVKIHALALKAPTTLTLDGGVVTVTQKLHILASESGAADDLDTINLGYDNLSIDSIEYYPLLIVQADAGDTITLKHGTGNIDLPDDTDVDVSDDSWVVLLWNGTNWQTIQAVST